MRAATRGEMAMDMKQLTTFITLTRTLNYQKAAEQLQYAPSTLFKHIQLLEQELGVPLLCKVGRQLQLTPQGEAFAAHAQNILDSYHCAVQSVSACDAQAGGITVGGCEINIGNSLLRLFGRFSQAYPDARISMLTSPNANVPHLVRNELIDLGFFYCIDGRELPGLETFRLYREPVYLLAGAENPILQKAELQYADLQGMPFVYPHDTCCFVSELLPMLRRRGVALGRITYLGSMQLVAEHVHAENAVTLMPHSAVEDFCREKEMAALPLGEPQIWAWNMLVYRSYASMRPAARALLRCTEEYAQERLRADCMLSGTN